MSGNCIEHLVEDGALNANVGLGGVLRRFFIKTAKIIAFVVVAAFSSVFFVVCFPIFVLTTLFSVAVTGTRLTFILLIKYFRGEGEKNR